MSQISTIENQMRSAVRNKASGAEAKLRRETSLVQQASRFTGDMNRRLERGLSSGKAEGPSGTKTTKTAPARPAVPAPDGYLRRSPAQPVRIAPDYYRRIIKRVIGGVLLCVVVAAVVWFLLRSGLLAF